MAIIKTRIYAVTQNGKLMGLVEAQNNVQVYGYIARKEFDVEVADQRTLLQAGKDDIQVEQAKDIIEEEIN
jgi:hypothetical protein